MDNLEKEVRFKRHAITIENLVPQNHLLRKLNNAIDFSFIHEEMNDSHDDNGLCNDPVIIVKYMLIAYLYDINPVSRAGDNIQDNIAYRWFFGFDIGDPMPTLREVTQAQQSSGGADVWEPLLERVLRQCAEYGFPSKRGEAWDYGEI